MLRGERAVKWLDPQRCRVALKPVGVHQHDGSEPTNVAVVDGAPVVENELDCRVLALPLGEVAGIDQKRSGEPGLNDYPVAGGQIKNN